MKKFFVPSDFDQVKVLIIGVQTPENRTIDAESYFAEFRELVKSNGIVKPTEHYVKLREIDNATFFTKGKLDDIVALCNEHPFDDVIISEPLLNHQERNLSKLFHARVFDRTELILDIFDKGAHSSEGKLQVAIAKLRHQKTRVSGRGTQYSQQSGKMGTRGPGETQKERELQHIERQITKLAEDLKHLDQVRATQRKKRSNSNVPHISIIGYTNAGKSTILNLLTKSSVSAENKLFATLDTTTRELFINGAKKGTISDTVGFVQNLPHELIEAFKSTLTDLELANLLLLVVDISNINWRHHIRTVASILEQLEVNDRPILYVFNKADLLTPAQRAEVLPALEKYAPNVVISAHSKKDAEPLFTALEGWKPS
jgi:GTPase